MLRCGEVLKAVVDCPHELLLRLPFVNFQLYKKKFSFREAMREFVSENRFSAERVRFTYIYKDRQQQFLNAVAKVGHNVVVVVDVCLFN